MPRIGDVDLKADAYDRWQPPEGERISQEEGLDVGEDTGTPVNFNYDVPFKFTGRLGKVMFDSK